MSKVRINAGRTVTQAITPMITPFDITIPIFVPRRKVMEQSARNPAIVVRELLDTDTKVFVIACFIARLLSSGNLSLFAS